MRKQNFDRNRSLMQNRFYKQDKPADNIKRASKRMDIEEPSMIRLNKFIADAGITSRRKADDLILQGVVKVNRRIVNEPGTRVHMSDLVTVNGEPIDADKHLTYILLNKPKNCITTTNDEQGRHTVMDIVHSRERIYPVGRLDRNTTGVILLTNDGELANRLMHPSFRVIRIYNVRLDRPLLEEDALQIVAGVELEDGMTAPCAMDINPKEMDNVILQLAEGKNREVRRMFEAFEYEVKKLDRKFYATLSNKGMKRGEFRHLTRQEVHELLEFVGLENRNAMTFNKREKKY